MVTVSLIVYCMVSKLKGYCHSIISEQCLTSCTGVSEQLREEVTLFERGPGDKVQADGAKKLSDTSPNPFTTNPTGEYYTMFALS